MTIENIVDDQNDLHLVVELQEKLAELSPSSYDEILDYIKSSRNISNKISLLQVINSIKPLFKLNEEKFNLCFSILIELIPEIQKKITLDELIRILPFHEFKCVIFKLYKLGLISESFLASKYIPHSIEYDFFLDHKDDQLKSDGINQNEIAISIRNDDLEKFLDISNFFKIDKNMIVEFSRYEKFSIVNNRTSLIEYAAFFKSKRIFKFLWLNDVIKTVNLPKYAVAGGDYEIIHILEDKNLSFDGCLEVAIAYFQNDIVEYLHTQHNLSFTTNSLIASIMNYNVIFFLELIKSVKNINDTGVYDFGIAVAPIHAAASEGYVDMVKILASIPSADMNVRIPLLCVSPIYLISSITFGSRTWSY